MKVLQVGSDESGFVETGSRSVSGGLGYGWCTKQHKYVRTLDQFVCWVIAVVCGERRRECKEREGTL